MNWILILLGIVLAAVAVFALQNPAVVTIRFLNLEVDASVLVVILVSFAAGVFSGILVLLPSSIRKSGRMRRMGSELRSLEKQQSREAARSRAMGGASPTESQPGHGPATPTGTTSPTAGAPGELADRPGTDAAPDETAPRRGLGRFFR